MAVVISVGTDLAEQMMQVVHTLGTVAQAVDEGYMSVEQAAVLRTHVAWAVDSLTDWLRAYGAELGPVLGGT